MSSIGTGIAAGVAQSAHNAQQVARNRDKERNQRAGDARQLRDRFEIHLEAIEEDTTTDTPEQLRVEGNLHDQEPATPQPEEAAAAADDNAAVDNETTSAELLSELARQSPQQADHRKSNDGKPLYQHLDVKA